jgi:protein-tyrosine phosphatase
MPDIVEWRHVPPQDALRLSLQRLADGGLVGFPTDGAYIVAADGRSSEVVERLAQQEKGLGPDLAVAVRGIGEALDWLPDLSPLGRRLSGRVWPGPLTLLCAAESGRGQGSCLPDVVRRLLFADGKLRLLAPCHEAILTVLHHYPGPVVFREVRRDDGMAVTNAEEAARGQPSCDLLLADGHSHFGQPASVVEVHGGTWTLVREGAVSASDLDRLACRHIVFVCTGNTCRSPMAEALCKKLIAEELRCAPEELPARGYVVQSAGLSALPGAEAAAAAVATAREFGADLAAHQSQPLTAELLIQADHIFTMTRGHLQALAAADMNRVSFPRLLSSEGADVPDPIGGEQEVYRECAQQILRHLKRRLPEFLQA